MSALLALTLSAAIAAAESGGRFAGDATLVPARPASADGRFRLAADLQPGDRPQRGGRFALEARLDLGAEAKALAATAACLAPGDGIFENGFEN